MKNEGWRMRNESLAMSYDCTAPISHQIILHPSFFILLIFRIEKDFSQYFLADA